MSSSCSLHFEPGGAWWVEVSVQGGLSGGLGFTVHNASICLALKEFVPSIPASAAFSRGVVAYSAKQTQHRFLGDRHEVWWLARACRPTLSKPSNTFSTTLNPNGFCP